MPRRYAPRNDKNRGNKIKSLPSPPFDKGRERYKKTSQERTIPNAESSQPIECRRCGTCCTMHQAFVTEEDLERILKHLGITLEEWDERYDDPRWKYSEWRLIKHVDGACAFLTWEGGLSACGIHSVKPACCARWESGLDKKECRIGMGMEDNTTNTTNTYQ